MNKDCHIADTSISGWLNTSSRPQCDSKFITEMSPVALDSTSRVQKDTKKHTFSFDPLQDALDAFARGEFLVVMDDENRENEGDLIIAASHCTTEKMAWMIKHTRYVTTHNPKK